MYRFASLVVKFVVIFTYIYHVIEFHIIFLSVLNLLSFLLFFFFFSIFFFFFFFFCVIFHSNYKFFNSPLSKGVCLFFFYFCLCNLKKNKLILNPKEKLFLFSFICFFFYCLFLFLFSFFFNFSFLLISLSPRITRSPQTYSHCVAVSALLSSQFSFHWVLSCTYACTVLS